MTPSDPLYLKKLEDIAKQQGVAEDLARGSTMALRARNAERTFLQGLADTDLPEPRRYSQRTLERAADNDSVRDTEYGPFPAGSPGVFWDIRRAAERNLADTRAAMADRRDARNQFIGNTALSTGVATALGTATAATIMSARERAAKEQQAINAYINEQNAAKAKDADEADLRRYGEWDDAAAAKEALLRRLPMADMDPLADMVPEMQMNFDLPPAPAQSQSDTAKLKAEYKTPPGALPRRRK